MKKILLSIVLVFALAALGLFIGLRVHGFSDRSDSTNAGRKDEPKIADCYHGVVAGADSVFTVKVSSEGQWSGKMSFVNKQKDSSYGTYEGTYENGVLSATYTFWSEGIESVGDYTFTRSGDNFVGSGYTYKPANDCELFTERKPG